MRGNIKLGLRIKLPAIMVALAVAAVGGVAFSAHRSVKDWLRSSVEQRLATDARNESESIAQRWKQLKAETSVQAFNAFAALALEEMTKWMEIGESDRNQILSYYRGSASATIEQRMALTGSDHRHGYSWRHGPVHETYATVLRQFGYADIYLVSTSGRVVYSTTKGPEFAQQIDGEVLKGSGLSRAVTESLKLQAGKQAVVDFEAFAPAGGALRAFVAQPVFDADGFGAASGSRRLMGTLVIGVGSDVLDQVLVQSERRDAAGRTFVVGRDNALRTSHGPGDAAFTPTDFAAVRTASGDGQQRGMIQQLVNGAGEELLAHAQMLSVVEGAPWKVVVVEPESTALALVDTIRNVMVVAAVLVLLPLSLVAGWVGLSIARPVGRLAEALSRIAGGDTAISIPARGRHDEIGSIADAVQLIRENMAAENLRREEERSERANEAAQQRAAILAELAQELDRSIAGVATAVSAAAEELNATARELDHGARETRGSAESMSSATARVVDSMQGIDTSAVSLRNAVDSIDTEVRKADTVAGAARLRAEKTGEIVQQLDEGAHRVSDVLGLISSIAEQTNLLALNATIEAARAGEAGRGFAVVAAEVKQLANQTARATDEIARQIASMNEATRSSVEAIGDIKSAIDELSAVTRRTADTVAAQKEASRAIVEDVNAVSAEISQISEGTSHVGAASGQTFQSAQAVLSAADELTQQAAGLQSRVEAFISRIRAA